MGWRQITSRFNSKTRRREPQNSSCSPIYTHDHASEIEQRFPRLQTMSWSRIMAIIKASTERAPSQSSNLHLSKAVPSRLVIYLLLGLLAVYPPCVFATEIAVCFTLEYGMTPSCTR